MINEANTLDLDDLDDIQDLEIDQQEPQDQEPQEPQESQEPNDEFDLTRELLTRQGISDINKIKFEDETGAVVERSWNNLTKEEQINILAGNDPDIESQLDNDEIDLLNAIRSSGMSVNDYLNHMLQSHTQPQTKQYKVDDLSDDDLYVLDILEKVGNDNVTDEELNEALENAKQNELLFKKTVEGLRSQYIQLEKDQEAEETNRRNAEMQEQYNKFSSAIANEIRGLNYLAGQDLELSNEDMNELYSFMLDLDQNGMSQFGKALQNPTLFTRAAFWLLNEDKITEELTRQMQNTYLRGYENAKKDMQGKSKLVFNQSAKPQNKKQDDWYADDDEW